MLISCSACNSRYLVNSADLKPDGRMVKCANCGHQWYQEPSIEEDILSPLISSSKNNQKQTQNTKNKDVEKNQRNIIKNLPSTVVNEHKVSILNSFLVVIVLISLITFFFLLRSFGVNIFVLIDFYLNEFYFNLKLIIADIAMIIHQIIN